MNAPRVLVAGAVLGQPMGGVRRHNQELLPRASALLRSRGGSLAVLAGATPLGLTLPEEIEILASRVPAGPPLKRAAAEGRAIRRALQSARSQGRPFDLVHTAHLPAPRRLGVPLALTLHDLRSLTSRNPRRVVARYLLAAAARRARIVICVSETVRREVQERFAPRASALVPNGCDHLELLARTSPQLPFLLHVGHLEARKNLPLLLRAMAADRGLPSLQLVGAPKDNTDAQLAALAQRLDIQDRVQFLGVQGDRQLARLYSQAACVVIPSSLEGFCIPAVEALRAGAPLALSHAAAKPLGLEGALPTFAGNDPEACADAIRRAMQGGESNPDRVATLLSNSTWDASASALVKCWSGCLS